MYLLLKTGLLSLSLGAGLLLMGCQSGGGHASASREMMMPGNAVACDKCQMTWVKYPIVGGDKNRQIVGYGTHQKMECPDCKSAAANLFATGNLKHECKACDGTMMTCDTH